MMKYTENALNILTTKTFKGIGDVWINKNLADPLPFEVIVDLLKNDKKVKEDVSEEIFLTIRENIKQNLTKLEDVCDGIVVIGDPKFPNWRGNVKEADQPNVLFYRGDLDLLSTESHNIAVIGVLNPDPETEADERKIVHQLVQNDVVIVSGLAFGCDSIAHDQTIKSQGATVAVLPSSLAKIQPAKNKELADEIVNSGGLLVTEYYDEPKSAQDLSGRYVKRDRLQALFSDVVLLSASYAQNSVDPRSEKIDSGSRHSIDKAKEYGIPRAVIYNSEYHDNPKYDLNRQVINNDKSAIVIDPKNISSTIDRLLMPSTIENLSNGLFSDKSNDEITINSLFRVNSDNDRVVLYKKNRHLFIRSNKEVVQAVSQLFEYYLNNNLYTVIVHNNFGFIKLFSDKEKQNYIMAIKVVEIRNEAEKDSFMAFFE